MKRPPLVIAFVAVAILAGAAPAPSPTAPASAVAKTDVTVEDVLVRFNEAQSSIETLQATFVERKEISLLKEPVVQRGTFYHARPQLYLWDYRAPKPKQVLLTSELLLAYYPDINRAEEVNVRRWTKKIRRYLQVGSDLDELRQDYDISLGTPEVNDLAGTHLLILVPRARKLKRRLDDIQIWIDGETGLTRRVAYQETKGDRTVFTFDDIRLNREIDPDRFEIDLPKNVQMGSTFSGFASR